MKKNTAIPEKEASNSPENSGRRKAVKTIVSGVTALAAYNMLPVRWDTPIIEQVFLPAHAETSGASTVDMPQESSEPKYKLNDTLNLGINARGCGVCGTFSRYNVVTYMGSVSPAKGGLPINIKLVVEETNNFCPSEIAAPDITVTTDSGGFFRSETRVSGDFADTIIKATAKPGSAEVGGTATGLLIRPDMACSAG